MGSLTGQTPASDYGGLLNVNAGNQIGLTNVLQQVTDGFGSPTPLQLSTIALNIIRSGYTFQLDGVAVTAQSVDINSMCQPNPVALGTGSITFPIGTTAERPSPPAAGEQRFNSDNGEFEGYNGVAWVSFPGGSFITTITGTANRITVTGGSNAVINIASSYVGQTSLTTLGTITTGVWAATTIGTTKGGTGLTSYTLGDILYASASNTLSNLTGNITAVKQYLSQTGNGVNSAAPVWAAIAGSDITGAALTKTDDTNVTLTLGGTPTTALLRATSLTLGWSGQLSLTRGGTNASLTADSGGIIYSTASAFAIAASTATAGRMLQSGASTTPTWSTPTYPSASGAAGTILRSNGTNNIYSTSTFADTYAASSLLYSNGVDTVTGLATANSASLVTTVAGVPIWSAPMTDGQLIIGSTGATPVAASLTAGSGVTITPGAGTITIAATGSGGTVTSVSGTANQINSTGGATPVLSLSSTIIAPGSLAVTALTANTAVISNGTKELTSVALTNGQLLIGSTGAAPVAASLTAGSGVTITPGAGTITIAATGGSGTINAGTAGQLAYYAANGTTLSGGQLDDILGTATNDNASTGYVGEFVSSVIPRASAVTVANATPTNITSISLTAGDWDVWGNVLLDTIGVANVAMYGWTSATSATLPDGSLWNALNISPNALAADTGIQVPYARYSLAATTTVYLSCYQNDSGGTTKLCGGIYARRAR